MLDDRLARPSDEYDDDDGFSGQGTTGVHWGRSRGNQSLAENVPLILASLKELGIACQGGCLALALYSRDSNNMYSNTKLNKWSTGTLEDTWEGYMGCPALQRWMLVGKAAFAFLGCSFYLTPLRRTMTRNGLSQNADITSQGPKPVP